MLIYPPLPFQIESRVVGGLLSAHDLSGDKIFIEKARDIADRLLPAWNTPTGIPYNTINLAHGNTRNPGWTGVSFNTYYMFSTTVSISRPYCLVGVKAVLESF